MCGNRVDKHVDCKQRQHRSRHYINFYNSSWTCLTWVIKLILLNELDGVLHGDGLSLLVQQEVQQVGGAHLASCLRVLPVDHVNLLTVCQQVVEVLDLTTLQGTRARFVTFLTDNRQKREAYVMAGTRQYPNNTHRM